MKIATLGLWHLGTVVTACLASVGIEVIAYDRDKKIIEQLKQKILPVNEPGLAELLFSQPVKYSSEPQHLSNADMVWVTYDTPVDEFDVADVAFVENEIKHVLPFLEKGTLILISSQIPVGTTAKLQQFAHQHFPEKALSFAYSPENLRLGKAIQIFMHPERIVVGVQNENDKQCLNKILSQFSDHIVWMSLESAEMTKHALNAFLATSVVFANELATLCEKVGADAHEVEKGLKSEQRIGPHAYLKAGNAFAGGTLARDVVFLQQMGKEHQQTVPLFHAVLQSNDNHKQWAMLRLRELFDSLTDKRIALLGLTYKPGTDTLRRSSAIELAYFLKSQGALITAYDPAVKQLPDELQFIQLRSSVSEALNDADAAIVATEWPEFSLLTAEDFAINSQRATVFDANGFLSAQLVNDTRIHYFRVGKST